MAEEVKMRIIKKYEERQTKLKKLKDKAEERVNRIFWWNVLFGGIFVVLTGVMIFGLSHPAIGDTELGFIWVIIIWFATTFVFILYSNVGKVDERLDPLNMKSGWIRCYLLVTTIFIMVYFLWPGKNSGFVLPTPLLIIFNLPFVYYGFKPETVLPKVVQTSKVPSEPLTNQYLIDSIPATRRFFQTIESAKNSLILKVNEETNKLEDIKETIDMHITSLQNTLDAFPATPEGGPFDIVNYFILLVIIAILNGFFASTYSSLTDPYILIFGAAIVGFGTFSGGNFSKWLFGGAGENLKRTIKSLKQNLEKVKNDFNDAVEDLRKQKDEIITKLNDYFENFKKGNILSLLPSDTAARVSILVMSLCAIGLLVFSPDLVGQFFAAMEFVVSFYFTSKKK